jgi:hypothetical protein
MGDATGFGNDWRDLTVIISELFGGMIAATPLPHYCGWEGKEGTIAARAFFLLPLLFLVIL